MLDVLSTWSTDEKLTLLAIPALIVLGFVYVKNYAKWSRSQLAMTGVIALLTVVWFSVFTEPPPPYEAYLYEIQNQPHQNPIAQYLWQWIKFICYGLGGVAGAAGLMFGVFGFWVGRGLIIKQGVISAIAGFAFILVIPLVRLIFNSWITFAEESPYVPEQAQTRLELHRPQPAPLPALDEVPLPSPAWS